MWISWIYFVYVLSVRKFGEMLIIKMSKTLSANKLFFDFDFNLLFHFISATAFGWGYMAPALIFPNERLFPIATFL